MTAEPDLLPLPSGNVANLIAAQEAEIEQLRAEVEMLRDAFSDEDMTAGAHWFGRYVEQKRRAEQLAEEVEALRAEVGELHMHAKRLDQYAVEKAAQALDWKKRAERLAETLRPHIEDLEQSAVVLDQYPAMAPTAAEMRKAAAELRAALEQESNDA